MRLRTVLRAVGRRPAGLRRAAPARLVAAFFAAGLRTDFAGFLFAVFAMFFDFVSFLIKVKFFFSNSIYDIYRRSSKTSQSGP